MKATYMARCFLIILVFLLSISCKENPDILSISIQDDEALGRLVATEIENSPATYPLLSRTSFGGAYDYANNLMQEILASEEIIHRDDFSWEINIIDDVDVLDLFALPGGRIYIYTGLVYFLDKEDDLAGALAHEIAHCDQRHITKQLQNSFNIATLLAIASESDTSSLGDLRKQLSGISGNFQLAESSEREADDLSVRYLAGTLLACNGGSDFFEKLSANAETRQPRYLEKHPDANRRIQHIEESVNRIGCSSIPDNSSVQRYLAFQDLLP